MSEALLSRAPLMTIIRGKVLDTNISILPSRRTHPDCIESGFYRNGKEDGMPSTQIQSCALCGLRFANGELLRLHIREDHLHYTYHKTMAGDSSVDGGTSQSRAGGPSRADAAESRPAHRRPANWVTGTVHRVIRAWHWAVRVPGAAFRSGRYAHGELLRASEAMIRSARAPQAPMRQEVPVDRDDNAVSGTPERCDRAA